MANPEEPFNSLVENFLDNPEVEKGRMFGFDSITVRSKTFALLDGDSMVFKLNGRTHALALALDDVILWNPFGHTKKEWVQVPFVYAYDWEVYAAAAMDYVESLIKVSA
jgi:hypothetical protein